MVDISNGIHFMTVTKGAFEGIYKHQGYAIVNDYSVSSPVKPVEEVKEVDNNSINEIEELTTDNLEETEEPEEEESEPKEFEKAELLETPISQWTKEQLKEFADANGVSLEGVKSGKEAKEIIKKFIDSAE